MHKTVQIANLLWSSVHLVNFISTRNCIFMLGREMFKLKRKNDDYKATKRQRIERDTLELVGPDSCEKSISFKA